MKLVERERIQTIPRGLWPPAQGCRVCEATLGHDRNGINRNAVVANVARRAETKWPQPRRGWKYWLDGDPGLRVPRNAGLWNVIPLGFSDGPKLRLVLIMPIPIALKAFVRIELPFQCQKLGEPGITALDLLTRSKLVIRQIITSFVTNRDSLQRKLLSDVSQVCFASAGRELLSPVRRVSGIETEVRS